VLSVVIPTLNAGGTLGRILGAIASVSADLPCEVIVADGGSIDNTSQVAADGGAIFVETRRGRGWQLGEGAKSAVGEWFLFLHADTLPAEGWARAVSAFMAEPDNLQCAGYFQFALDDRAWAARWLESVVAARSAFLGLPYGDQGLLINRVFYEELGGFKPMPLMEDVEIIRRIGRHRLKVLDSVAVTSSDRYRREGYVWRPVRNFFCLSLYSVGVPSKYIDSLYR
jgi:rSAM/selenodomain-associated transferase 2